MTSAAAARAVTITAIDPAGPSVKCKLYGGVPKYTSQNGWQFTQLPRRQAMTEYMGYNGYTLVVPVMFGDGRNKASIEPQLEVLRGIERNPVGPRAEPAVVQIDCPAIPINWLKFVINDTAFNTEYRNNDGTRYYAQVDITFFEWQPTSLVLTKTGKSATQLLAAATAASSSSSPATTLTSTPIVGSNGITVGTPSVGAVRAVAMSTAIYVVRAGDTLETIAKACLGNANQWKDIAALNSTNGNPIRDPKSIYIGQNLRMPAGAKVPTFVPGITPLGPPSP